jgi:hypothetical protein
VVESGNREEEPRSTTGSRPSRPGGQQPSAPGGQQPSTSGQQVEPTEQPIPEQRGSPYNLWFAIVALAVAVIAYALTMLLFRDVFEDPTVVTGALGALFTLIGTVTGAYFGIKSSGDTADRAERQLSAASDRVESANEKVRLAYGRLDPNVAKEIDKL